MSKDDRRDALQVGVVGSTETSVPLDDAPPPSIDQVVSDTPQRRTPQPTFPVININLESTTPLTQPAIGLGMYKNEYVVQLLSRWVKRVWQGDQQSVTLLSEGSRGITTNHRNICTLRYDGIMSEFAPDPEYGFYKVRETRLVTPTTIRGPLNFDFNGEHFYVLMEQNLVRRVSKQGEPIENYQLQESDFEAAYIACTNNLVFLADREGTLRIYRDDMAVVHEKTQEDPQFRLQDMTCYRNNLYILANHRSILKTTVSLVTPDN